MTMKFYLHEYKGKSNHLLEYKGLRVAFDSTEWFDGDLYLRLGDKAVCCLDEESYMLELFETNEYVIDNNIGE